jgi:hypothetical protein
LVRHISSKPGYLTSWHHFTSIKASAEKVDFMRTTLTLDDQLAKSLQEHAHQSHQSFKAVVNQAISLGLGVMEQPPSPIRYRQKTVSMGQVLPGINLDKALALASHQEEDALIGKLEMRK